MKQNGFTLIEVVVVVAIICILLIPIGNLLQQIINANIKTEKNFELAKVLNKTIEEVVHFLKDINPSFVGQNSVNVKDNNGNVLYRIIYEVSNYDNFEVTQNVYNYREELKKVDFKILDKNNNNIKSLTYFIRVNQ